MPDNNGFFHQKLFLILYSLTFGVLVSALFCSPCLGTTMQRETTTLPAWFDAASAMSQPDPKINLLILAESEFKQGSWQEAGQYAETVLVLDRENRRAHGIRGAIFALTGQKELARKELSFLQKVKEQEFYLDFITAVIQAQDGNLTEAQMNLDKAMQKDPDHPVATYYAGSLKLARGELDGAKQVFSAVLQMQPDFVPALAGLGQISLQQHNLAKAAEFYQKSAKQEPENIIYRKQLLDIYQQSGQKEAADREIKQLLYYTPGIRQSYLKQGMQLLAEGSYPQAVELADKVVSIYSKIPEAYYIKGAAQINLHDLAAGLGNIELFISEKKYSPQAHHYAGMAYLAAGDFSNAEKHYTKAIGLNPEMGRSFIPLTIIEQLKGNYDLALEGLRLALSEGEPPEFIHYLSAHILLSKGDKAGYQKKMKEATGLIGGLQLEPEGVDLAENVIEQFAKQRNLLLIYFFNGWYGKTFEASNTLIKFKKDDQVAWYYKALSQIAHRKPENAIESFQQLVRINPGSTAVQMRLGQLYVKNGDHAKAAETFKKVITDNPEYYPAYIALGDVLYQTKAEESAIETYEKAMEKDPETADAYQRLAAIFCEKPEKIDAALLLAEKAKKLRPEDPYSLDTLGWIYVRKGEPKKAIQILEEAIKGQPQDPVIQYHLGMAYYEDNKPEEAKKNLTNAVAFSGNFRGYDNARKILEKISQ